MYHRQRGNFVFSQCYLQRSSPPWRSQQMTIKVIKDLVFQIVLVHLDSFSAFATHSCHPQQSEMGTRKPFYLYFAFLGLWQQDSCIFLTIILDRFSSFHINKYKYELRYLYHENVAAIRTVYNSFLLIATFYTQGIHLYPTHRDVIQEHTATQWGEYTIQEALHSFTKFIFENRNPLTKFWK